jgi:hypothetical protein|tara:strand:+ start:254 stop:1165 length:912 start_codon:yes stop_codon:yes gene_type:complete
MSEVFSEDSQDTGGEPSEALDEGLVDFGADLDADTQEEATPVVAGHSEGAPRGNESAPPAGEFDPDKVDWLRVDINTIPDQYKPLQALAKNMQASYTQEQQSSRQIQEQAQAERQQYLQAISQLNQNYQNLQNPQQTDDPFERVAQHLDEDERRGLQVVQTLQQQAMAPLLEQVQSLQGQLQQANQGSQAFQSYIHQQQAQARQGEINDTRSAYGSEVDSLSNMQIAAMRSLVDQGAGVKAAFESVTGKLSEQIVAARETHSNVRANAKKAASSVPPARIATGGDNAYGETDLDADMARLFGD